MTRTAQRDSTERGIRSVGRRIKTRITSLLCKQEQPLSTRTRGRRRRRGGYLACVVSNDCKDLCEGGVDGGPVVGEGGAGRSRALHQGRLARRRSRLSGPLLRR